MTNRVIMINEGLKKAGMKPSELTAKMGMNQQNYQHWINRDIRLSTIDAIAKALGMTTSDLIKLGE